MCRDSTIRATCYGLATAVPHQSHVSELIFAINPSELKSQYEASKQQLSGQVRIDNGDVLLPTNMCYTLSAGYELHNFHPKDTLAGLQGTYCLNTIFLKNSELVYTLDEHRRPKIQSYEHWKASIKTSFDFDINLSTDPKDRILLWTGQLSVAYLDSKTIVRAVANSQVHEASHMINQIMQKEDKIITMIELLEKFMQTKKTETAKPDLGDAISQFEQIMTSVQSDNPRTKRGLLDFLLGPSLGV